MLNQSSVQSSAFVSSPALPPEKPKCTGRLVGITVPWSSWLKLGTEQRVARHGAQNPCRPLAHPTAAGPSLSACSAELRERLTPQAQTGRAQAGYQRGMQADTDIRQLHSDTDQGVRDGNTAKRKENEIYLANVTDGKLLVVMTCNQGHWKYLVDSLKQ